MRIALDQVTSKRIVQVEPFLVAHLVLEAVPRIGKYWDHALRKRGVRFGAQGVYCHGRPRIAWTTTSVEKCELADLLIVSEQIRGGRVWSRRAVLLQAKRGDPGVKLTASPGGPQNYLYTHWPTFEYERSGMLNGRRRSISPKAWNGCGSYLVVPHAAPRPRRLVPRLASPTASGVLAVRPALSSFLTELIFGSAGQSAIPPSGGDWPLVVEDLLDYSSTKELKVAGMNLGMKQSTSFLQALDMASLAPAGPRATAEIWDDPIWKSDRPPDDNGGVSVARFVTILPD